ncbi:MAG TPA: hypothetical protein VGV38_13055, partial [Pyrinomonadaceae bacterium]|nr:hypothetical protein [Pyrinomonadaceae bacterium]
MSEPRLLPAWAEDLRRRYLRGESHMFVLHGNVYDSVVHRNRAWALTDFLTDVLLRESKDVIAVYNVSTGVRFVKGASGVTGLSGLEELITAREKDKALPALERLMAQVKKVAVVVEYAETLAPAGDPTFHADADRASVVTLHRWSFLPEIEQADNVVLLVSENLTELAPKLISNPKVAVVEVPMPDRDARRAAAQLADPRLNERDAERYAEITAGLKAVQIASILAPPPPAEEDAAEREAFIVGLLGGAPDARERAHKFAALTAGMSRDEVRKLLAYLGEVNPGVYLVLPNLRARHHLDLLRALRIKKRNLSVEAAGALQVNVELVGPVRHHEEEDAAAVRRVGHELLDARDDARRSAAVALAVGVAEGAVALVNDDDDLSDGLDDVQDFFQVALGRAHPLRAKVLELDGRKPALSGEGFGDEGLARAHRAGEQQAHRDAARAPLADVLGDDEQVFLDLLHAAHHVEAVLRLDELDQTEALALKYLALAPGDESVGLF